MTFNNNIIFIRHAENVNDENIPNNLLPLTKLGEEQALRASKELEGKFDVVVCSISKRAKSTAKIIAPNCEIIYDERLIERGWGNKNKDGLETDDEAKKRIYDFLTEYTNIFYDKNILFVTHGSLMILAQIVIEEKVLYKDQIEFCDIVEYTKNGKVLIKNKI